MIALLLAAAAMAADTNHFLVCPTLPPASDTTSRTIYGLVTDPFTRSPLPSGFTGVIAEAVRAKMTVPPNLPTLIFDPRGWPTVFATVAFSVMPDGTAQNVAVMSSSSSATIDSLLTTAIEAASREASYPPLPPGAGAGIRLAVQLSPDSVAGAAPMFTMRVPTWRDFAAATLSKKSGRSDTVAVDFVVNERGTPLLNTVHLVRAPGSAIAHDYLDSLKTAHFVPGHIQKCAVRSLVNVRR
jgi:hypothetical protein